MAQVSTSREILDARPQSPGGFDTKDTLIVLGLILALAGALFCWAYFIRRRPNETRGSRVLVRPHRRHRRHARAPSAPRDESVRQDRVRRRRRRRRHPAQDLPRNPTLGETGGLPPVREDRGGEEPPSGVASTSNPS